MKTQTISTKNDPESFRKNIFKHVNYIGNWDFQYKGVPVKKRDEGYVILALWKTNTEDTIWEYSKIFFMTKVSLKRFINSKIAGTGTTFLLPIGKRYLKKKT